jgi:hypothetical protein
MPGRVPGIFFVCRHALFPVDKLAVTHPGCTITKRARTFTAHRLTAAVQKSTPPWLRYPAGPFGKCMAETACLHGFQSSIHNIS